MASSSSLKAATQKCLNDIQKILNERSSSDSEIEEFVKNIKVEVQKCDAEVALVSLNHQLDELPTYLKNLDNGASKKSLKFFTGSSSKNHLKDTQKEQVKEHLRRVAEKAKCLNDVGDSLEFTEKLPHLCFAYCSLFPQDYKFDVERLIHLWIAEGFLEPSNLSTSSASESDPEEIGRRYLKDMVERSIFEEVKEDKFGEVTSFIKMKPAMHEIAGFMADWKDITADRDGHNVHGQVQRASFILCSENRFKIPDPLFDKAMDLKSFFLFKEKTRMQEDLPTKVLEKVLESFKRLSVLDLRELQIKVVPSSIAKLKELKYLDLSENTMEKLPSSITKLSKLETLKLFYCYLLKELPKDFKNLTQLKHLDMEGCFGLTCMPPGMSKMTSLQTLSAFVASTGKRGLEELDKLNQLKGDLKILHLERVKDAPNTNYLENKQHLKCLTLKWALEADYVKTELHLATLDQLKPHPDLKVLIIREYQGLRLSSWLTDSNQFQSLVKVAGMSRMHISLYRGSTPKTRDSRARSFGKSGIHYT